MTANDFKLNERPSERHLIRLPEAAAVTRLPLSPLPKSFMAEEKRPLNIPLPPPHKRIGRAVYILADHFEDWVKNVHVSKHRRKVPNPKTLR